SVPPCDAFLRPLRTSKSSHAIVLQTTDVRPAVTGKWVRIPRGAATVSGESATFLELRVALRGKPPAGTARDAHAREVTRGAQTREADDADDDPQVRIPATGLRLFSARNTLKEAPWSVLFPFS